MQVKKYPMSELIVSMSLELTVCGIMFRSFVGRIADCAGVRACWTEPNYMSVCETIVFQIEFLQSLLDLILKIVSVVIVFNVVVLIHFSNYAM